MSLAITATVVGITAGLTGIAATGLSLANGQPTNSPSQLNNGIGAQYAPGVYAEYEYSLDQPFLPDNVNEDHGAEASKALGVPYNSYFTGEQDYANLNNGSATFQPGTVSQLPVNPISSQALAAETAAGVIGDGSGTATASLESDAGGSSNSSPVYIAQAPASNSTDTWEVLGVIVSVISLGCALFLHRQKK